MKSSRKLIILIFTLLALTASAYAQSPREQLQQMVEQLQKTPNDNAFHERPSRLLRNRRCRLDLRAELDDPFA